MDASKEFMDLVSSMINPDATMRPELTDIIVSPWMKGKMASKSEVVAEMEKRH